MTTAPTLHLEATPVTRTCTKTSECWTALERLVQEHLPDYRGRVVLEAAEEAISAALGDWMDFSGIPLSRQEQTSFQRALRRSVKSVERWNAERAAAEAEREACAQIADNWKDVDAGTACAKSPDDAAEQIANRIRARTYG
jgi:hypothetical protein